MRKHLLVIPVLLVLLVQIQPVQAASFSFNWKGTPTSPLPWHPGSVNDWDLLTNVEDPTDLNGTQDAVHGPNCEAPPATHQITNLTDSAFICNNHLMTAVNGGYAAVYMTPAQLIDWSGGSSSLSWRISTQRMSARDWWSVDITPFADNLVLPLATWLPAYQGWQKTGLEIRLDSGTCNTSGGSILRLGQITNANLTALEQSAPCIEDTVPPSAATRTPFQLDVSSNHVKLFMPGTSTVYADANVSLPFNKAVVQFSHHSYNPTKEAAGVPATWHWSDVNITNSTPFTMLRPTMPHSLHAGQSPVLTLPQPAPANSFLRFAALGQPKVALNGGAVQAVTRQAQLGIHFEHFASFWMPVPAGTTSLDFSASLPSVFNQPYWIEDVSVWSLSAMSSPATPTETPTAPPSPAAGTPVPAPPAAPPPVQAAPAPVEGSGPNGQTQSPSGGESQTEWDKRLSDLLRLIAALARRHPVQSCHYWQHC